MKGWLDVTLTIAMCICFLGGFFVGIPYATYRYNVWRAPCTRVFDGNELIYEGNSYFYDTESRGTATMFKEHEQRFIMPRKLKEIMSNNIRIETISCKD